jgi:CspA family cold shock protein
MATGTVKWFNNAKGYGFICSTDTGEDIFAHFTAIEMSGYKTLKAGQLVHFEMNRGPKGLHATNIRPELIEGEEEVNTPMAANQPAAMQRGMYAEAGKARHIVLEEVEMAE